MLRFLLIGLLLGLVAVQDEPYPGQAGHAEPPVGWFCQHQTIELNVPPAHACTCERVCDPEHPEVVHEDQGCTVYCHADHCHCGAKGCP